VKEDGVHILLNHGLTVFGQFISWAELVGQLCALAVVFLAQRRTLWTWPVQIAATLLLVLVYTSAGLGGLAARQIVIMAISVYGWWSWSRRRDSAYGIAVRSATWRERAALLAVMALGTAGFAWLLSITGASWAPLPDAWIFVGTVIAFAAQGLGLTEFWLVWLLVDAVGVPLQMSSGLWFSAAIYLIFAGLVIRGWLDWHRTAERIATPAVSLPSAAED
jgi:nicotinamide mononucleotide transporter